MNPPALVLAFALLSAPLAAQTGAPATPPSRTTDPLLQDAIRKVEAGDTAGALKELEAQRAAKTASPQALALLGVLHLQQGRPQESLDVLKPLADAERADPAVLYNAARAALALKQTELGAGYLSRAAQAAPDSPAARDLGMLVMRQGRLVEAYALLFPWAAAHPADGEARLAAASLAVQLERPGEAEQLLSARGLSKDDPSIQLLRGRIAAQKGEGPGAVALLEPLLQNPRPEMELEIRRALAEAYLVAARPADAVKVLKGHVGQHPGLALLLGRAQHKAGDNAAALATLEPFASRLPSDPANVGDPRPVLGIALETGDLLIEAGRAAEAVPVLEKAAKLYPQSPPVWVTLARALQTAGRGEEAQTARLRAEAIVQAATAEPSPAGAPLSAEMREALTAFSAGQTEKALVAVRRALIAAPDDVQARALEMRLLLTLNRKEEALQSIEEALRKAPDNPDLLYQRGAVQMAFYNWEAAEKDLRRTLEIAPRHTAAMNELAVLLTTQGKNDEARALLEKVLEINPQDRVARFSLENLKQ